MPDLYDFHRGTEPLLLSIPHAGTYVPQTLFDRLSDPARKLPDTDWHLSRLYNFAGDLGASILKANYSRYMVDLNRPPDDRSLYPGQATTGLCPTVLFDGTALYREDHRLTEDEVAVRRDRYWRPYHDKLAEELARMQADYGYALLYDAHSIASRVPRLFAGRLPDLNLGTVHGTSCAPEIETALASCIRSGTYSSVVNGRFIGGYITRHYGNPVRRVQAVQMEIAQVTYMDEAEDYPYMEARARVLQSLLRTVLETLLRVGK